MALCDIEMIVFLYFQIELLVCKFQAIRPHLRITDRVLDNTYYLPVIIVLVNGELIWEMRIRVLLVNDLGITILQQVVIAHE